MTKKLNKVIEQWRAKIRFCKQSIKRWDNGIGCSSCCYRESYEQVIRTLTCCIKEVKTALTDK